MEVVVDDHGPSPVEGTGEFVDPGRIDLAVEAPGAHRYRHGYVRCHLLDRRLGGHRDPEDEPEGDRVDIPELTISQLAKRFGLSRSTLLYYDSIGLLSPSERSSSNYRLYSDEDLRRMESIDVYRRAGLRLKDIARVLDSGGSELAELLERRLRALNDEIRDRRRQQKMLVTLLRNKDALRDARHLDKESWTAILRATGLSEQDMRRWHVEFERLSPEAHRDFLESLGIDDDEVDRIREWSRSIG